MTRRAVSNILLAFAIELGAEQLGAQGRQPGQLPPTAAKVGTPKDLGWPRVYADGIATIAVHQPQVEDWRDFAVLEARFAVEIQQSKDAKKTLAAVQWKAETDTNIGERTVVLKRPEILSFRIPGETEEQTKELETLTLRPLPTKTDVVALDRILAYLDLTRAPARGAKLPTEDPPIMVSTT